MRINSFVCVITLVVFVACKPERSGRLEENMDEIVSDKYDELNDRNSAETTADHIKSGIIYMQSTQPIHGSDVERVIYFDDYGRKRRTETTTIIRAGEHRVTTTNITLDVDGYSYKFDPEKTIGYRAKVSKGFNPTQIDFTRLDKLTMEDFGIKSVGTETVAGKECVVYTIDYPAMGFSGRYAVWNNLPLHEEFRTADFGYEYIATKLDENANIPNEKFVVPSNIEFHDAASPRQIMPSGAAVDSALQQAVQQ